MKFRKKGTALFIAAITVLCVGTTAFAAERFASGRKRKNYSKSSGILPIGEPNDNFAPYFTGNHSRHGI